MKRGLALIAASSVALVAVAAAAAKSNDTTITGAGSTFVQPLVVRLDAGARHGVRLHGPVQRRRLRRRHRSDHERQVDFGASDAPLTPDQQSACSDCVQIPWALSAVAIAYNVPGGPAHVNLDGTTISKIFLGSRSRTGTTRRSRRSTRARTCPT